MTLHLFPVNVICCQQTFFGKNMDTELIIAYVLICLIGISFIVTTSLNICFLDKQIKIHHHKLIQLQFDSRLNLDLNSKLKVITLKGFYTNFKYIFNSISLN